MTSLSAGRYDRLKARYLHRRFVAFLPHAQCGTSRSNGLRAETSRSTIKPRPCVEHSYAGMAKLADAQDLGSCEEIRVGSTPITRTNFQTIQRLDGQFFIKKDGISLQTRIRIYRLFCKYRFFETPYAASERWWMKEKTMPSAALSVTYGGSSPRGGAKARREGSCYGYTAQPSLPPKKNNKACCVIRSGEHRTASKGSLV